MFKATLVAVLFFITFSSCFQEGHNILIKPFILEQTINKSVKCVRETLNTGIPELGLPSFDPLILTNATLDFDAFNLTYLRGQLTIDGSCPNIVNFNVQDMQGALILIPPTYTVNFTLHYSDVSCQGRYKMNLTIGDYNVWGSGDIISDVTDLTIAGHIKAVIWGSVDLQELQAPAKIGSYNFNITGLYNDEEISRNVTDTLREKVPQIINEHPELFTDLVGPLLVSVYNGLVNDEWGVGIIKEMTQRCIIDILFPPEQRIDVNKLFEKFLSKTLKN